NGERIHQETVLDAMQKAGLTPSLLQCGAHLPYDKATADAMVQAGQKPEPIHNNCSGKHTGFLSLAKHLGLPLDTYLDPKSELQQLILANVADVVGLKPADIAIGVDGCGVPVFGLPLFNMAYSFARLADPSYMPAGKEEAGRLFREAMLTHPHNVGGNGRICTEIMELPGRRFVAKSGAEGVYCLGVLPEAVQASPLLREAGAVGGIGIAVKAEDGHKDVRHLVTVEILEQLGLLTDADRQALARYRTTQIKNHAGKIVGEFRPTFKLERA
ncbi:MAG TPA: asparaginase, partial [Symbiobacteriaceae bacterium]|nr:asparaginase [Symbiobacteriaceae bacterium]